MNDVFADTYYFIALLGPAGRDQQKAVAATIGRQGRLVTTAWILTEFANTFHRVQDRAVFLRVYHGINNDPDFIVLEPNQALFDRGLRLFQDRPDKEWSLTDCISFVAMGEMGIAEALTGDHHFEQAGFTALLK